MTEPDRKGGVGVHKCLQNFLQNLVVKKLIPSLLWNLSLFISQHNFI